MSCYFLTSLRIISSNSLKNLVMMKSTQFTSNFNFWLILTPSSFNSIKLLVISNWNRLVNDITNRVDHTKQYYKQSFFLIFNLLLFFLYSFLLSKLLLAWIIFIGFLFGFDGFSDFIPFFVEHIALISN